MVSLSKKTRQYHSANNPLLSASFSSDWVGILLRKKGIIWQHFFGGNDSIDTDAGCVLLDAAGNKIDTIWFRKLKSSCGSVVHSGDNLTGEGDGDDEIIHVNLLKIAGKCRIPRFLL
uniref:Tellurium resistance protein TerD n=1 Tax=Klebsiella pneumoniae TaxID=573 RepID=A0A8B0SYD4_KLEPN|nr:Tellurium resistance protein TerD [Klebsiella pneumoniae]